MLERLARALPQLGDRCRELMRLKLQGKTFPEIQKIMGVAAIKHGFSHVQDSSMPQEPDVDLM